MQNHAEFPRQSSFRGFILLPRIPHPKAPLGKSADALFTGPFEKNLPGSKGRKPGGTHGPILQNGMPATGMIARLTFFFRSVLSGPSF